MQALNRDGNAKTKNLLIYFIMNEDSNKKEKGQTISY